MADPIEERELLLSERDYFSGIGAQPMGTMTLGCCLPSLRLFFFEGAGFKVKVAYCLSWPDRKRCLGGTPSFDFCLGEGGYFCLEDLFVS